MTAKRRRSVKIISECLKDLEMFLGFLKIANTGISLNSIAFGRPTCSHLQVRLLPGSRPWRVQQQRLGIEMVSAKISPLSCLKQPAQTSGSNYLPVGGHPRQILHPIDGQQSKLGKSPIQASVRIEAARKQATIFLSLGIKCYSQWFA